MESSPQPYDFKSSFKRIGDILNSSEYTYEETDALPKRAKLTFKNGFYSYSSCMYVDIRDSSGLGEKYKRPYLARLYRAYLSECVAIMNRDKDCAEINIEGDGVWCVVNTPLKSDIAYLFSTAAMINSMIKTLNHKAGKIGFDPIKVGIGLHYGRVLMIKAGHSGSTVNEVVYMGAVVNQAAKLSGYGHKSWGDEPIMMSQLFYENLGEDDQQWLSYNSSRDCYHGNVVNTAMEEWYQQNCG